MLYERLIQFTGGTNEVGMCKHAGFLSKLLRLGGDAKSKKRKFKIGIGRPDSYKATDFPDVLEAYGQNLANLHYSPVLDKYLAADRYAGGENGIVYKLGENGLEPTGESMSFADFADPNKKLVHDIGKGVAYNPETKQRYHYRTSAADDVTNPYSYLPKKDREDLFNGILKGWGKLPALADDDSFTEGIKQRYMDLLRDEVDSDSLSAGDATALIDSLLKKGRPTCVGNDFSHVDTLNEALRRELGIKNFPYDKLNNPASLSDYDILRQYAAQSSADEKEEDEKRGLRKTAASADELDEDWVTGGYPGVYYYNRHAKGLPEGHIHDIRYNANTDTFFDDSGRIYAERGDSIVPTDTVVPLKDLLDPEHKYDHDESTSYDPEMKKRYYDWDAIADSLEDGVPGNHWGNAVKSFVKRQRKAWEGYPRLIDDATFGESLLQRMKNINRWGDDSPTGVPDRFNVKELLQDELMVDWLNDALKRELKIKDFPYDKLHNPKSLKDYDILRQYAARPSSK